MSSLAATKIITKGLDCGSACDGLITTHFSLYCPSLGPLVDSGGGPYPYPAWNRYEPGQIQDFYQPVEQDLIVPRDQEAEYFRRKRIIVMKVNIGSFSFEKEYAVPIQRAKIIVSIINVINTTQERFQIAVNSIKRIVTAITIQVKKLRITRK